MASVEASTPPSLLSIPKTNGVSTPTDGTAQQNGATTPANVAPPFDNDLLRAYLLQLLPPLLGASPEELEDQILGSDFEELASRFAAEGGGPLYVVKVKEEVDRT